MNTLSEKVKVICPYCKQERNIVKNVTKLKNFSITETGVYEYNCKACSCKNLADRRSKEGFFYELNKIKANQTRISPLNKGDVYGDFTVLADIPERKEYISKKTGKKTVRALWLCQCKCGTIVKKTTTQLITKKAITKCTACAYRTRLQSLERQTDIERLYRLSIVSRVNKSKGRIVNFLSLSEFETLIKGNCYYCGSSPKQVIYGKNKIVQDRSFEKNGIDRLDSMGNYSIDNCVPCCKICNIMKSNLSKTEFITHINKIHEHSKTFTL